MRRRSASYDNPGVTTEITQGRTNRALTASAGMLLTSAFMGGSPLVLASSAIQGPFLVAGVMRTFIVALTIVVTAALYWPALKHRSTWAYTAQRARSKHLLYIGLSYLDFPALLYSFRFTAPAISAICYESWIMITMFLIAGTAPDRYAKPSKGVTALTAIAVCGAMLTAASTNSTGWQEPSPRDAAGIALALLAAGVTAFTAYTWTWAHQAASRPDIPATITGRAGAPTELFFMLAASVIVNGAIAAAHVAPGIVAGGTATARDVLQTGTGAILTYGIGSVLWRASTRLTDNVAVHAIGSATPLFAVGWLLIAGQAGDVNPPLILGAATVLAVANGGIIAAQAASSRRQAQVPRKARTR